MVFKAGSIKIDLQDLLFPTLFIIIGILGVFNHSLWRDEMQGWIVAWKSNSWIDLWSNNAPSGHPVLWSALIYLSKGLTNSPISMQLMHFFLGSISIIILWLYSPFSKIYKILITFGYFPFWEYFFISRHYVIAELLMFIFLSIYGIRKKTYIPFALIIGLLVNTHALAWSIAFAIGFTLFIELITSESVRREYKTNKFWRIDFTISLLILTILIIFAIYSLLGVREYSDLMQEFIGFRRILKVIGQLFGGYTLIIPNSRRWFDLILCSIITVFITIKTIGFVKLSKASYIFFLSGLGYLLIFNYFIFLGDGSRHYGFYFLILLGSVWIAINELNYSNRLVLNDKDQKCFLFNRPFIKFYPNILTLILSLHFIAGVYRVALDFTKPYSAGKETAQYIIKNKLNNMPIFGTRDVELTPISGYLDKDIYYPEIKAFGSFTQWKDRKEINRENTLKQIDLFIEENQEIDRFLTVLSKGSSIKNMEEGDTLKMPLFTMKFEKAFTNSWIVPERYYVYIVEKIK